MEGDSVTDILLQIRHLVVLVDSELDRLVTKRAKLSSRSLREYEEDELRSWIGKQGSTVFYSLTHPSLVGDLRAAIGHSWLLSIDLSRTYYLLFHAASRHYQYHCAINTSQKRSYSHD